MALCSRSTDSQKSFQFEKITQLLTREIDKANKEKISESVLLFEMNALYAEQATAAWINWT